MKKNYLFILVIWLPLLLVGSIFIKNCKKEAEINEVSVYTSLDESVARACFKAFKAETGIKVIFVRLSTGECQARLEAEKENPQVNLWVGGVGLGHIIAKNKGLTMKHNSPNAKNIPNNFKDKDGYWTGMYVGALCFVSNKKMLKKYNLTPPKSWEEIIDPKYKGHVQVANPGSSGTAYNVLATLVQIYGEDKAFDVLKELDKNITMYTRSGSAPGKKASIGEVTVAIGYSHDAVKLKNQGYPLKITFPKEGTGFEVASISMVKGGPKEEIKTAKILYDWMLTKNAAKIFASMSLDPIIDVEIGEDREGRIDSKDVNTIKQDDEWAAKEKLRLVEKWNQIVGGKAKTEAKKSSRIK